MSENVNNMQRVVMASAVIAEADDSRKAPWKLRAIIVSLLVPDLPRLPVDVGWLNLLKLTGTQLHITYSGTKLKSLVFRAGILCRVPLSPEQISTALEQVAAGRTPELHIAPDILRPMHEPCVRVPLSLLRELRGQEAGTEYSRRALVSLWQAPAAQGEVENDGQD